jgi:hypothetical protein
MYSFAIFCGPYIFVKNRKEKCKKRKKILAEAFISGAGSCEARWA